MAEEISLHSKAGRLTLTAAILASGLGFLMNSAVTIALPQIQRALDEPLPTVQWIITAYVLTLSALILVSGAIGDLVGRKRVFNIGIAAFTLGALAAGSAPDVELLIGFRAIQGCGAALMVPGSLSIINVTFPKSERGRVIGLWAGVSGAIAAFGPIIGGVLVEASWRLVFLSVVPLGLAALLASIRFVPESELRKDARLDMIGTALILAGLFALSFALIRLPDRGMSAVTIAVGGAGLVLIALFAYWEVRTVDPVVPFSMFTRHVAGANAATFLLYFSFQSVFFLLSFLLQQLLGLSSGAAGLTILPTTVVIATLSGISGSFTDRLGPRPQMLTGPTVVAVVVTAMIVLTSPSTSALLYGAAAFAMGVGMVIVIPAITKSALDVEERFSGAASGVNNALARTAGLIAVALNGALLVLFYRAALSVELQSVAIAASLRAELLSEAGELLAGSLPDDLSDASRAAVEAGRKDALAAAFRGAFSVVAVCAGSSAVVAWFTIKREKD